MSLKRCSSKVTKRFGLLVWRDLMQLLAPNFAFTLEGAASPPGGHFSPSLSLVLTYHLITV
jgi:hypothetical protein